MSPPRITVDGDEAAALQLVPVAHNLLHKVRTSAATSGAQVTGLSLAPTPDSFIYATKLGDMELVHIFVEPSTTASPETFTYTALPDLVSGLVRTGRIITQEIPDPNGGPPRIVKKMDSFRPTVETAKALELKTGQEWYQSQRLAVPPAAGFPELQNLAGTRSQYSGLCSSMYSGRMRRLVQTVMGYGRLPFSQVAATGDARKLALQYGVQVVYDYRWHRTHGVTVGEGGKLWLLEISIGRGVLAMPLPLVPHSARLKDSSENTAIIEAVTEYGGLPLGTGFPTGPALEAAIKGGDILRLLTAAELTDFYRMTPYSTAMGWSFNDRGTEAHNTGWYWHEDQLRRAAHYSVQIKIGAVKKDRRPGEPMAVASARLQLMASGVLYHPSAKAPPPLKFHEPLIGSLLSVEMLAGKDAGGAADTTLAHIPVCLCPVHVVHIDDALKTVWYFWDRTAKATTEVANGFEECMVVGSWTYEERYKTAASIPTFFTTDFDDRRAIDGVTTRTTLTSTDAGWIYVVGDNLIKPIWPQYGFAGRYKLLRTVTETSTFSAGDLVRSAIVVPGGTRDGYVYARLTYKGGSTTVRTINYRKLLDPNSYETYRTFFYPPRDKKCITQHDRKVIGSIFDPSDQCAVEYANEGEWMNLCDNADMLPKRTEPSPSAKTSSIDPSEEVQAFLVTDSGFGTRTLKAPGPPSWWLVKTPSDLGFSQFMFALWSCWGAEHIAYNEDIDGEQTRIGPLFAGEERAENYSFVGRT